MKPISAQEIAHTSGSKLETSEADTKELNSWIDRPEKRASVIINTTTASESPRASVSGSLEATNDSVHVMMNELWATINSTEDEVDNASTKVQVDYSEAMLLYSRSKMMWNIVTVISALFCINKIDIYVLQSTIFRSLDFMLPRSH